jgi:DNA-binding NarL/FixJ family response regulator
VPTAGVLIVDDQEPFRRAARVVIAGTPGFHVAGEATSGEEAVEVAALVTPDLVLMDIHLGGIDGYEAARRIRASRPSTRVLLVSTYAEPDLPPETGDCGAVGYVNKEEFGPDVLRWAAG